MLTEHLCQLAGVDARHARHLFALEPVSQTLTGVPMGIGLTIVTHDNGQGIYPVALHESGNAIALYGKGRHAIVAYQRIGQRHQLSGIARICQALGIAHHGRVEYHLSNHGLLIAEALSLEFRSVLKDECYIFHLSLYL